MSMAWEVTSDDIEQVLDAHGVKFTEEISDLVDGDEVEDAILHYCNFENQCDVAISVIEDQLIEAGVISAPKKFPMPDDDPDFSDDCEEFEEDDE